MHRLEFQHVADYSVDDGGVEVPIILRTGGKQVRLAASIDSGASFRIFSSEIAEALGFTLEECSAGLAGWIAFVLACYITTARCS